MPPSRSPVASPCYLALGQVTAGLCFFDILVTLVFFLCVRDVWQSQLEHYKYSTSIADVLLLSIFRAGPGTLVLWRLKETRRKGIDSRPPSLRRTLVRQASFMVFKTWLSFLALLGKASQFRVWDEKVLEESLICLYHFTRMPPRPPSLASSPPSLPSSSQILMLDEATSSLDAESEYKVQEACDRLMVGRTVVVIAHRLSTVRNAAKIVVMGEGGIKNTGTHEELMKHSDIYRQLIQRQIVSSAFPSPSPSPVQLLDPQTEPCSPYHVPAPSSMHTLSPEL
ncbi:hypothetical protein NSK_005516 [Nannochloropsis salina CCMP1776]|uniref:ABC transmembrane type-1 domain-containing protein n=1 Tax=Nannochloropsis salina CCMP1776 TaxID=1027361 RepID=A0A4D9CV48_9STRA|nr:hypothetical protein NSK_005516 [Nannochloropsis salina CCMP1776]|eukprot:TFJ83181.1 hypothetical protein NSK_005516 [Nannochloropsis salina CCMP1776]